MTLSRRDMLKMGLLGGAAVALPLERTVRADTGPVNRIAAGRLPAPFTIPFSAPPALVPTRTDATTDYYKVYMKPIQGDVLPGLKTPLWGYNGLVPGPTVHVKQGRKTVIRHVNNLPAQHPVLRYTPWTSVHLHGSASLPQFDGYASDITNPGQYKDYHYPNFQAGRTLWYHDHGVHHTAENVLMGLARSTTCTTRWRPRCPFPQGEFDVPLIVSDAMFNADGSLLFDNHSESGMCGDVILVNGRPWPVMKVKQRKYRFRILNASISRSYSWSLDSGAPMTVIATDGGLMPHPSRSPASVKAWPSATRSSSTSPSTPPAVVWSCRTPARRTTSTTPTPTRSWPSTWSGTTSTRRTTRSRQCSTRATPSWPSPVAGRAEAPHRPERAPTATGRSTAIHGTTSSRATTASPASPKNGDVEIWEIRTPRVAGSIRYTSTSSTSRSWTATASRRSPTSSARRTSSTSARTRRFGCSCKFEGRRAGT